MTGMAVHAPAGGAPLLALYRGATTLALPLIQLLLQHRIARGKEDRQRIEERRGIAGLQRPDGPLIWIHAASVGEAQSVLALVDRMLRERPTLHVLMTTGTVTSAALMEERLPARAIHQFVPVDRPAWVRRFLGYWKPDAAFWVESELWPNLLLETAARGIPMALINARISADSHSGWQRARNVARHLLGSFSLVLAQDETTAARLRDLGAANVVVSGNLKTAAAALPARAAELMDLQNAVAGRPLWLAASTHPGEEELAADTHLALRDRFANLLTIIAPRHPRRGGEIAAALRKRGLNVAVRSAAERIEADTDIYLADGLGELGLFYRIASIAFIGGSLVPHGGQNMLEAAQLHCAILHGPHIENFREIADELAAANASSPVTDAAALTRTVAELLGADSRVEALAEAAAAAAATRQEVLDAALASLAPLCDRVAPRGQG